MILKEKGRRLLMLLMTKKGSMIKLYVTWILLILMTLIMPLYIMQMSCLPSYGSERPTELATEGKIWVNDLGNVECSWGDFVILMNYIKELQEENKLLKEQQAIMSDLHAKYREKTDDLIAKKDEQIQKQKALIDTLKAELNNALKVAKAAKAMNVVSGLIAVLALIEAVTD